jgi:ribosomal protein S12 methylthiotransferase accessory factor
MSTARVAFRAQRPIPEKPHDCKEVFEGAAYMARADHARAFDFLLQEKRKRPLSDIQMVGNTDSQETLKKVVELLRQKALDTYAVDLTTDEAIRSGIRVVRVLIPGLQPLSFHHRARYLGHRRLYEAPRNMGYPVHREEFLNDWPQPFS